MKIVMMLDWFLYYSVELANALSKRHEVMMITRDHNYEISSPENETKLDDFLVECLNKEISKEKLRFKRGNLRSFSEAVRLYRKIKSFNPDVIHIQENSDWRIYLIAKMIGLDKVVLTIHDVIRHPGEPCRRRKLMTLNNRIKARMRIKAKKIIVHGEYLKEQMLSNSKSSKNSVQVIPHGALSIYKKWDDESIEEEENTVLFFGRMTKYKGMDTLIKSIPIVAGEIPNVKVIIAGRGEDLDEYKNDINEYVGSLEIHNKFIPNSEVPRLFRRASVVVLPYIEASQSGVIPIAYVFGKPVVVTRVGSIPEVVEEGRTGFIVPPNSPRDLAQAIINVLKNKELKEAMSKNALAKAANELSWGNIAKVTAEFYSLKISF